MSFKQITETVYRASQKDINIFEDFTKGLTPLKDGYTVFCEDSGAIYKVGKYVDGDSSPLCYILDSIEKVQYKTANPVCMSQDLAKFKGRNFIIKELPIDEASIFNTQESVDGLTIDGVRCAISTAEQKTVQVKLPAKDMVCFIRTSNIDTANTYYTVKSTNHFLTSNYVELELELGSESNYTVLTSFNIAPSSGKTASVYFLILDKKWTRHMIGKSSQFMNLITKSSVPIVSATDLNASSRFINKTELLTLDTNVVKYGLLSNIDTYKFADLKGKSLSADKFVSKDDFIFRSYGVDAKSSLYLLDTFVAEISD